MWNRFFFLDGILKHAEPAHCLLDQNDTHAGILYLSIFLHFDLGFHLVEIFSAVVPDVPSRGFSLLSRGARAASVGQEAITGIRGRTLQNNIKYNIIHQFILESNIFNQSLSQDLEPGCPKFTFVTFWVPFLFFKGDHNTLRLQWRISIYLLKWSIIYLYNIMGIILR